MKEVKSVIKVKASKELSKEIENELRVDKDDSRDVEDNSESVKSNGSKV